MEKTIVEKLNLTKYKQKVILNRPNKEYFSELQQVQEELPLNPVDLMIVFVTNAEEFKSIVSQVIEKQLLVNNGLLYVAYPKKGNKKYETFVHRDEIFPTLGVGEDGYIAGTTYKFNRMVSLDEVFTIVGIKNSEKKETSKVRNTQSVNNYVDFIPQVEAALSSNEKVRQFFSELTPGYKKRLGTLYL
ncbi:hypothetical protein [Enterococcus rivorum]|uniref:hypothetical protein n=1 Tax=Enterococcus rivorum TaxID=762845 RepID=UPI00362F09BA